MHFGNLFNLFLEVFIGLAIICGMPDIFVSQMKVMQCLVFIL